MTLFRESMLFWLCLWLRESYKESALCRMLTAFGRWCEAQIEGSRVLALLCREGAVAAAWRGSFLCRLLTFFATLPGRLLHAWYNAWRATFEDSFFARLAFELGEGTALAEGWLVAALWVIPFAYWNNAYSMLAFASLLVLFHAGAMRRREFRLDLAELGFYPLVFFGAVFLALAVSSYPSLSTRFLGYHVSAALCVLVTVSAVRNEGDLKRLAAGGSVCVAVSSLYGVSQRLGGLEVKRAYVDSTLNPDMPGRVYSFFDNPNTFAEVLALLLPLALALAVCSKSRLGKLAAWGTSAVGFLALGMTYSRGSWVGFACAVVVTVFLWRPGLLPLLAVVCVAAIPLLPGAIWTRILSITNMSDTTTSSRFPLYQAALALIRRAPFTGAGLGSDAVRRYISDHNLYRGAAPFVHAHNFYMQVWIETGLLGIASFLAALLWNIKRGARTVRHCSDSPARTITAAAVGSLAGIAVGGVADYPWHYPRVMCIFWFIFAVVLAGAKVCRQETAEKGKQKTLSSPPQRLSRRKAGEANSRLPSG